MGGTPVTAKYIIHARMEIFGTVEKPDIVGAIFGQTEGLLGEELDFRELQKSGRLGRIEVSLNRSGNRTICHIKIPSNLDRAETALIAAALETIDKVGPYSAKAEVSRIEDVREEKRKKIIERAKELLRKWEQELPESKELTEEVLKSLRATEIRKYGPEGLPAGPDIDRSDTIIIVEGRADVINLLRHGYRNVIAMEGATLPKTIIELSKRKNVILLVDGDRGGELIVKNVVGKVDVDYVARAPPGREVEELTGKEIAKALRNKLPLEEFLETLEKEKRIKQEKVLKEKTTVAPSCALTVEIPEDVMKEISNLKGTLEALVYNENWKNIARVPVKDLVKTISGLDNVKTVIFDGIITQRIVDIAYEKKIELVIGARIGDVTRLPENMKIITFGDILQT
ncbi:MAG: DNA primase [Thermofilum sp. ex4484_79]|nr:MAG: DNA primase [Thermofilum sp. ex4484_79]